VLLAHGTVPEVIAGANLVTYTVSARESQTLNTLADELASRPGIDSVAPFGSGLHVSGRDEAALEAAIAPYRQRADLTWARSDATLEDVFIDLMSRAQDNFQ
jgi:ABC-2 type transport system ATP-binding protein